MVDFALHTYIDVFYEGVNITGDISADLISFSYTDNEGGKSDDIAISLKNDHGKWTGAWLPIRGDKVSVTIVQRGRGSKKELACGTFTVDELETSGPPDVMSIKAISIPVESDIFRLKRSQAWEGVRLSEIAQNTASKGSIALQFFVDDDPLYDRQDQRNETDMAFLQRVCKSEGFSVKATDGQLVIFSPEAQGEKEPVRTVARGVDDIKSYSFKAQNNDVFWKCTMSYVSPKTGKVVSHTSTQAGMTSGKTKRLTGRASSLAEAERKTKAALLEANRGEVTGSLSVVGDTLFVAGATIIVDGFNQFDGKYYIKKADHVVGNGYVTSLELSNTRTVIKNKPSVLTTKKAPPPKVTGPDGLEGILGK